MIRSPEVINFVEALNKHEIARSIHRSSLKISFNIVVAIRTARSNDDILHAPLSANSCRFEAYRKSIAASCCRNSPPEIALDISVVNIAHRSVGTHCIVNEVCQAGCRIHQTESSRVIAAICRPGDGTCHANIMRHNSIDHSARRLKINRIAHIGNVSAAHQIHNSLIVGQFQIVEGAVIHSDLRLSASHGKATLDKLTFSRVHIGVLKPDSSGSPLLKSIAGIHISLYPHAPVMCECAAHGMYIATHLYNGRSRSIDTRTI